jgi:hypothetical protein
MTLPLLSTAAHKATVGHDTPVSMHGGTFVDETAQLEPSTWATVHIDGPPSGVLEVITLPTWSTATQKSTLGQETAVTQFALSTWASVQADVPPVGLLEVTTVPLAPTATQRLLVGQDTLLKHGDHSDLAAPQSEPRTRLTTHAAPVGFGDGVEAGDGGGVMTIGVGGGLGDAPATLVGLVLDWMAPPA